MKTVLASVVLLSAMGVAHVASAEESSSGPSGIEIGVRPAYAIPLGQIAGSSSSVNGTSNSLSDLGNVYSGQIPLWFDLGYRFMPQLYAGAFVQYGIAFPANNATTGCGQSGVSCSGSDVLVGADLQYHIAPQARFDPWVGAGFGYEWLNFSGSDSAGTTVGFQFKGWQFANFQVGGDIKVTPSFGVGPFVMLSLGQYASGSVTQNGQTIANGDVQNQALHEWLTIGVRGEYDIGTGAGSHGGSTARLVP